MEILQNVFNNLINPNVTLVALINIPLSFIEATISMLLFLTLFNINSSTKQKILYVLSFSTFGCISRYFIPDPFGTFFNLVLCPILIILFFKTSILKAIISEISPIFLSTLIDFILAKIFFGLFNASTNDIITIPIYRLLFSFFEYFSMFIIYFLLKKYNVNLGSLGIANKNQKNILFLNSLLGIIAISSQMYVAIYYMHTLPIIVIIISITSLIAYFIVSYYNLINTNNLNIAKQNLEETRLMNKTLTILNDKIRAFRHDFNNIIQAIGGYINSNDMNGLKKYYSQLLKDCQEVTNLTALNTSSINNPAIYSLISSKYYLASEKDIEFNIDIFMDLNSIDMKIYEFCRILGILLDNAIQATQECDEKQINISIRNDSKRNRQLLIIENTYKDKDIDTEKIYEKGYSTKEGNTGLGLWEVRQILSKNTNLNLFTSKNDKYFSQQLEIYK